MKSNPSVYINTSGCNNWILKIIAEDIERELTSIGVNCSSGPFSDYSGQDIAYHMWWRNAEAYKEAKVNSVFITHTDDSLKEHDLVAIKEKFDSFIAMSTEDAQFLYELGFDKKKAFGVTLPVRNTYVRPVSVGIFSSCYPDNRKNENWLLDFCTSNTDSRLLNFVFIGSGWSCFVNKLSEIGCSFEWHNVSRDMPYEYFFQQNKLAELDYYLYMGMDGGAMGSYDAYAQGVDLCISNDGYHKDIPNIRYSFETKTQFDKVLSKIIDEQRQRIDFFTLNSVSRYVQRLFNIWTSPDKSEDGPKVQVEKSVFGSVLDKRRANYFHIGYRRIRQTISNYLFTKKQQRKKGC